MPIHFEENASIKSATLYIQLYQCTIQRLEAGTTEITTLKEYYNKASYGSAREKSVLA